MMLSFPAAVVRQTHPEAFRALMERAKSKKLEFVDYASKEFTVVPIDKIADNPELFTDKITLIGSFSDIADSHKSPVDSRIPGAMIHAYTLSTILDGRYFDGSSKPFNMVLAFILSFSVVWMSTSVNPRARGLFMRCLQIAVVLLSVWLCYYLFIEHRYVLNCAYLLLTVTFALFASDIWNGVEYLAERYRPSFKKIKQPQI